MQRECSAIKDQFDDNETEEPESGQRLQLTVRVEIIKKLSTREHLLIDWYLWWVELVFKFV